MMVCLHSSGFSLSFSSFSFLFFPPMKPNFFFFCLVGVVLLVIRGVMNAAPVKTRRLSASSSIIINRVPLTNAIDSTSIRFKATDVFAPNVGLQWTVSLWVCFSFVLREIQFTLVNDQGVSKSELDRRDCENEVPLDNVYWILLRLLWRQTKSDQLNQTHSQNFLTLKTLVLIESALTLLYKNYNSIPVFFGLVHKNIWQ